MTPCMLFLSPLLHLLHPLVALFHSGPQFRLSPRLCLTHLLLRRRLIRVLWSPGPKKRRDEHPEDGSDGVERFVCAESGNLRVSGAVHASLSKTYQEVKPPDPVTQNGAAECTYPSHVNSFISTRDIRKWLTDPKPAQ